jgi:hypothetical protein
MGDMKSTPKTVGDFENFREFVRKVVNVPGAEVKRQIEREHKERKRKRTSKTASHVSRAKD